MLLNLDWNSSAGVSTAGTFGRVLECWDRERREHVAIKVVRSINKYRRAAMIEIDVLNLLSKNDQARSRYIPFDFLGQQPYILIFFLCCQLCTDFEMV